MKMIIIIILSILVESQGQYIDSQLNDIKSTTENIFDKLTDDTINVSMINNFTTSIYYNEISQSSSYLSSTSFVDFTTHRNDLVMRKEQWFNYRQKTSHNSSIFWRKIKDKSLNGWSYIIKSNDDCKNRMCRVKLKYNGSISNNIDGCLSFILRTRGQPVGQLWIEEDEEQESFSQKIQLTNSSLRVEHSLKPNIKNLSIDARILLRNPKMDSIVLSNLNVNWNGSCPKYRSMIPIEHINLYESTSESNIITLTNSDDYYEKSLLTTNKLIEFNQNYTYIQSSTRKLSVNLNLKNSSKFFDQSNIQWILTIIILFCLLIIILSFIYGLWSIQEHYRFIWHVRFDYPIQFISRRSISSSTKTGNKIESVSKISNNLFQINYQQDDFESFSTNSIRSMPSTSNAYF